MKQMSSLVAIVFLVGACSQSALDLPDQKTDAVLSEESRVAALLANTPDLWFPGDCSVRLLGQAGSTSFVWAYCSDGSSGRSLPLRIDGDQVSAPGDGSSYSVDVQRMFPADLAEAILDRDERIFPEELKDQTVVPD